MECPKDKNVTLVDRTFADELEVKHCSECRGSWIPAAKYEVWQARLRERRITRGSRVSDGDVNFVQSPYDSKAGLCPECRRYLSRTKIMIKTPFYLERCPNCGGVWCDRGEWEVLEELGMHESIPQLFSGEWQSQMRSTYHTERERQATIEKLGPDVAELVFELAEILENHPYGDFGVAYLMRRLDKPQ